MPYACPTRAVEPGLHESALRRLQNAYVRSDTRYRKPCSTSIEVVRSGNLRIGANLTPVSTPETYAISDGGCGVATPMLLHTAQTKHATLARLEPEACQPSVRHLSDGCPTAVRRLSTPVRCLSDVCPTPVRRQSDACPTPVRRLSDACPTPVRPLSGACPKPARRLPLVCPTPPRACPTPARRLSD